MSKIVVLGCGAMGRYIAIDLCKDPGCEVVSVDVNQESLERLAREHPIQTRVEDLSTVEGVTRAVEDADLVIGSVPYSIGYTMLEGVIRAGKNIVDISYFDGGSVRPGRPGEGKGSHRRGGLRRGARHGQHHSRRSHPEDEGHPLRVLRRRHSKGEERALRAQVALSCPRGSGGIRRLRQEGRGREGGRRADALRNRDDRFREGRLSGMHSTPTGSGP